MLFVRKWLKVFFSVQVVALLTCFVNQTSGLPVSRPQSDILAGDNCQVQGFSGTKWHRTDGGFNVCCVPRSCAKGERLVEVIYD